MPSVLLVTVEVKDFYPDADHLRILLAREPRTWWQKFLARRGWERIKYERPRIRHVEVSRSAN